MLSTFLRQGVPAALQQASRLLASSQCIQDSIGCLILQPQSKPHRQGPAPSLQLLQVPPLGMLQQCYATYTSYDDKVDRINELFVEARDEIEYAKEDAETTYFNESATTARDSVAKVMEAWQQLMDQLPAEEQGKLQRSMGLKMEQLKAELQELDELHA